jgi:hypothetical protein
MQLICGLCLFGLALAASSWADSPGQDEADVAIVGRPLDAATNASLGDIITLAAGLRLDRNGLKSVVVPEPDAAARDPGAVLATPASRGAGYLLLVEYSDDGKKISLRLSWFDRDAKRWIADLSRSGPENMLMDELIFGALGDLLDRVAATKPITPKTPAQSAAAAPAVVPAPTPAPAPATVPAPAPPAVSAPPPTQSPAAVTAAPAAVVAPSVQGAAEPAPPLPAPPAAPAAVVAQEPPAPPGPSGLELAFDGGPFVAGGALGDYFGAAGGAGARATWYFPGRNLSFGLGIAAAGLYFQAQGPLESATGILAPLALDFRVTAPADQGRIRPCLHVSAGAALMSLQTAIYGAQSAVLPFAGAGLGIGWVLDSGLGFSVDASYLMFLDGSDLIAGFDPAFEIDIPLGKKP